MAAAGKAGAPRDEAVTVQSLTDELARYAQQLTVIRDAAVRINGEQTGRGGRYGYNSGADLDTFLRRGDLPRRGEITVSLPDGFEAGHYTAAGLAHQKELLEAAHGRKIASLRRGALDAQRQGYVSLDELTRVFEQAGLEPPKTVTTVTASGSVSFPLPEGETSESVTAKFVAAFAEATGVTLDTSAVRLASRQETA